MAEFSCFVALPFVMATGKKLIVLAHMKFCRLLIRAKFAMHILSLSKKFEI